jgi:nitrate reductase gamma subunit
VSRADYFLWVALPYIALAIFVVGHVWRYRRGQLTWTARSTQLLERRLLRVGSLLFHFGFFAVIGGHVLGILIPKSWMDAIGIDEHVYHYIAVVAGLIAGVALTLGFAILVYRRLRIARVRVTTPWSDILTYPLLGVVIVTGMVATIWGSAIDEYVYRDTVSPWFRGIFSFDPRGELMVDAPLVFQIHAVASWLLIAAWPFTRLVHAWSVPLTYFQRSWILYRSRNPRAALAYRRARAVANRER